MTKAECAAGVKVLFVGEYPGAEASSYTHKDDWEVLKRKPSTLLPIPHDWEDSEERVLVLRGDNGSSWWINPCCLTPFDHTMQVVFTLEGEEGR